MGTITTDYLEGLGKQVFIYDYLKNGLFPGRSDITKMIRSKKRKWEFGDKFEYRMFLSNTNTGGTLNSQVFHEGVGLRKPGELEFGTFQASYGTIADGFDVKVTQNLETENKQASFERDYAMMMHSLRMNISALFKNFAIHGRFGVVHQIRASITAPNVAPSKNPQPNVFTPVLGVPFTIKVPNNVFETNFKRGKYLIKTKSAAPWGNADVSEIYMVLENQPNLLSLLPCGTTVSSWEDGQFLEVAYNREIAGRPANVFDNWDYGAITVASGPYQGTYDQFVGTGSYSSGGGAITGAMEGMADLFPWYSDPTDFDTRLGMDLPFRGQANRLRYSIEQAGQYVVQQRNGGTKEHVIDTIMRGLLLANSILPKDNIVMFCNPITLQYLGYEEGATVTPYRNNLIEGPIIYQRGVESVSYQVGNRTLKEVVTDNNMPTDVILIGPKNDLSYNCWDNTTFEIEKFIKESWGDALPPDIEDLAIPDELVTSIDVSKRITFGSPILRDGNLASFNNGAYIRHPETVIPVAMNESGALFTEYPYAYTVVKLLDPIIDLPTF